MHVSVCMSVFPGRSTWTRSSTPTNPPRTTFVNSTQPPADPSTRHPSTAKKGTVWDRLFHGFYFFSHISSYNGRFMMQLQLLYIGPICGLPAPVFQPRHTQTPISLWEWCTPHLKRHTRKHTHCSSNNLSKLHFPFPSYSLLKKICLCEEVPLNKAMDYFFFGHNFSVFNKYKNWENSGGKSKPRVLRLPPDSRKANGEQQSSEYLCVHSFLMQS